MYICSCICNQQGRELCQTKAACCVTICFAPSPSLSYPTLTHTYKARDNANVERYGKNFPIAATEAPTATVTAPATAAIATGSM